MDFTTYLEVQRMATIAQKRQEQYMWDNIIWESSLWSVKDAYVKPSIEH